MRQRLLMPLKLLLALVAALAVYRLWQTITQERVLFAVAHAIVLVLMAAWTVWMGVAMHRHQNHAPQSSPFTFSEGRALFLATPLIVCGFILAAWSAKIGARPIPSALPWLPDLNDMAQAMVAGGCCAALIWTAFFWLGARLPRRDPAIFPLVAMLCAIGLILLFRLGPDIAELRGRAAYQWLFWRQLRSLGISMLLMYAAVEFFTPQRIERLTRKRYVYAVLAAVLILATALFGVEHFGRKLAVNLGVMEFQTVELVKLLALFFMTGYFRFEAPYLEVGKGSFGLPRARYWLPYITMWALVLAPLVFQKDLGPTALLFMLFLVVFYLGTGSCASVWSGIAAMSAIGVITYMAGWPSMVRTRVDMWLDPFTHSQNMAEVLWAVADGGFLGAGIGMGLGHHIPVVQSDFNFAVIAEELGFFGVAIVLACFGLLIWRVMQHAKNQQQGYLQMLLAGLATLWMVQSVIILGGNLGLLPLTGITLPFISYGGSSLVMNFVAVGLVLRVTGTES